MRSVQYEILNPQHHCGAGQEECKELASSKFVQRTTDKSQKLVEFLVREEKGACCELHTWMSSVGAAACGDPWEQCSSSDSSKDLSGFYQRHSCLGNCLMSECSNLSCAFPELWVPPRKVFFHLGFWHKLPWSRWLKPIENAGTIK